MTLGKLNTLLRPSGRNDHAVTRTADSPPKAFLRWTKTSFGWFSIGLGLVETAMPRRFAKMIGAPQRPGVIRLVGIREITAGLGLFTQRPPTPWFWARVGGDLMDLTLLARAYGAKRANKAKLTGAIAATTSITLADLVASIAVTQLTNDQLLHVKQSIVINQSPDDLYRFWHDYPRLADVMPHLQSVQVIAPNQTQWQADAPLVGSVAWKAETTLDQPNQAIGWQYTGGSLVKTSGTVRFVPRPSGQGTIVQVDMRYQPPLGIFGAGIAKLLGRAPEQQIHADLLRLKQALETGEIPRTEGQPAGRATSISLRYDLPVRR